MARTKNFDETAVLDKAVAVFSRQGYMATTPANLVAYLGISRSSLYATYGDKRSLFIKALHRYGGLTTLALRDIVANTKDAQKAIRAVFEMTLQGCFEDEMPKGCFLVNSVIELPHSDEELIALVNAYREEHRQLFVKLIKKGQKRGQLPPIGKPDALADYMINCLSGLSVSAKSGAGKKACRDIIKNSLLMFGE